MRKLYSMVIAVSLLATLLTGCSLTGTTSASAAGPTYSIDGPYTVTATAYPFGEADGMPYYYVGAQYVSDEAEVGIINTVDTSGIEKTIKITSNGICTKCDIADGVKLYSYYCDGNLLSEGAINMLTGETIFATFQNLLTKVVYREEVASSTGPYIHLISNLDNHARDLHCDMDESGTINVLSTTYPFNDYDFNIMYMSNPDTPVLDLENTEKINKADLIDIVNTMADYMFYSTVQANYEPQSPLDQPEEPVEVAEEPEEPETLMVTQQIATLSDAKDLFLKISFSDHVADVEFLSPTGGSYKVESGNVEMMQDSDASRDAYYRIPDAEIGTWQMVFDNAQNEITVETVTDNKIKITALALSPIKDGILSLMPTLAMDKGLDINYEYHVDILQDNHTVEHFTNILNTKTDKAKYNVSVMDLAPGVYKARLRLEYMYDGQHYINMYTSDDFSVD